MTTSGSPRVAVVTGASSGIGAATVRALAAAGFATVVAARRLERCEQLAREVGGRAVPLDVTDPRSVAALAASVPEAAVVVHSAGGALGLDTVEDGDDEQWRAMFESNVLGVARVTRALLPALRAGGDGHIVVIGSIAGTDVYPGGGGYTAAKHAAHALCGTLRLELLGEPIRVSEVAPGMVDTEFSVVRFGGDSERAAQVYRGLVPLSPADVAEIVAFLVTRPAHVNIDYVVVKPRAQASVTVAHRTPQRSG